MKLSVTGVYAPEPEPKPESFTYSEGGFVQGPSDYDNPDLTVLQDGEVVITASDIKQASSDFQESLERVFGSMKGVTVNLKILDEAYRRSREARLNRERAVAAQRNNRWHKEQDKRDRRALRQMHANKNRGK